MSDATQRRKPQLSIPVDDELLAKVESAADREHRTVSSYVRHTLAKVLDEPSESAAA